MLNCIYCVQLVVRWEACYQISLNPKQPKYPGTLNPKPVTKEP